MKQTEINLHAHTVSKNGVFGLYTVWKRLSVSLLCEQR